MSTDYENLDYPVTVRMPSVEFERICKDLSSLSDTVRISVTKESVKFSTPSDAGADIVCAHSTTVDNPEDATTIEINEPLSLTFTLKCTSSFSKATALSKFVILKLSPVLPAIVEYPIEGMGHLRYSLPIGS